MPYGHQEHKEYSRKRVAATLPQHEKILPCPFCGHPAFPLIVSETDGTWVIECDYCEARGPSPNRAEACSIEEAIGDWNCRAWCDEPYKLWERRR